MTLPSSKIPEGVLEEESTRLHFAQIARLLKLLDNLLLTALKEFLICELVLLRFAVWGLPRYLFACVKQILPDLIMF